MQTATSSSGGRGCFPARGAGSRQLPRERFLAVPNVAGGVWEWSEVEGVPPRARVMSSTPAELLVPRLRGGRSGYLADATVVTPSQAPSLAGAGFSDSSTLLPTPGPAGSATTGRLAPLRGPAVGAGAKPFRLVAGTRRRATFPPMKPQPRRRRHQSRGVRVHWVLRSKCPFTDSRCSGRCPTSGGAFTASS